tara:strand:+ start:1140 stop:1550 length:411 start_codon:yes stop_codon:yes gene_type:complete
MADVFKAPTRNQISKIVGGDPEFIKAFEQLFRAAGETIPSEISGLQYKVGFAQLDFGASAVTATVAVTGIETTKATSVVLVKMRIEDTDDHVAEDMLIDPIRVEAFEIVAGTGFTIYGTMENAPANGKYNVQWALM